MKLLGSSKGKITKNDNGDNIPNLEIIEVVQYIIKFSIIIMNKI